MKKVLIVVICAVVIVGAVVAMQMYKKQKAAQQVEELSKFEIPEEGFEVFLNKDRLKWKNPDAKRDDRENEPAPLYHLAIQKKDILPNMAEIIKDGAKEDNIRCAAVIVVAHTKEKEGVDPLIEALKAKDGRLGECASVMLQLMKWESVPEKIGEVIKSAGDEKVKMNAIHALTHWIIEDRKTNKTVMDLVVKNLDTEDKEILLMLLGKGTTADKKKGLNRLQFSFSMEEGAKDVGDELIAKLLPMVTHEDEEIAKAAASALEVQFSFVGDAKKVEMIEELAPLAQADKPKYVRVNGVKLLSKLNRELAQNVATISMCNLDPLITVLDADDPDLLNPVLDTMETCGTKRAHRKAVQSFQERIEDEALEKRAAEVVEKIAEREQEGG